MTALARILFHPPARLAPPRAVLKTLTYGLTHMVVAMAVVFALTGDWRAALAVGLIEPAAQTLAYVLHERAWARAERQRAASPASPSHQGPV
ncbi:DUF2061 domain-containing protein [Alkalicaulis satelles]|uniref:DUF2061 domain-containing protein n=1 Tax=Alkalicaulis satelles TaxID=2609175 RepID=A0A5M6ZG32_9PROT|nr:DUF2061 domain-containing protein [Alkalicaulis satelles]KAA5803706.1 DUF2061 domain-containing protein [Alkalicaulis satelles]